MTSAAARPVVGLLVAGTALVASAARAQSVKIDSETFGGLEARAIGPAAMSGRIAALDAVAGDRLTVYVGAAGGGLWKSTDGGLQFKPVFDRHVQSIGAVAVDPSNPAIVWVGTGESWVRNSVSAGDGVYRSTDAGDSWTRVGLEQSERIARIVVHPGDGDIVYVCATGHLFDDHPERGVFRTKNGGRTWDHVLTVGPDTGCADLALDPADPATLYAAMWQVRRLPWFFTSGGPRSGLFKSTDGGATWQPSRAGLPAGDLGRIGLAVAPSSPNIVYASVEAKRTALYRSEDRGTTWIEVNASSAVSTRPFYYARLVVDPSEPDRVYKMGQSLAVSDDGGRTFSGLGGGTFGPSYHSDVHDLWVHPGDPDELIIGTDGGVYFSHSRGSTWRFVGSLPVSQFYHVSYDMAQPYNVYGGLQDNSTWYGPSRRSGGIANRHWQSLTGGDGFWAFVDPTDPDIIYDEYQGGNLFRIRRSTLESKDIKPTPGRGEPPFRFNWNTPIHLSANAPGTIYYGAQFLFRSRDKGDSWERLSPDLTTNDPAKQRQRESGGLTLDDSTAENHCTIFAIAESPRNGTVIWVGTDDGNVQLTRDGGKTWTNVAGNVAGVPPGTWVSSIEAGHFDPAVAYVTFDGHMTGDMATYVFRTADYGKTWQALATAELSGYAHVVKEDLVNPDLLFLGTEAGLFVSLDGGRQWGPFLAGLPRVAVRDAAVHPRDHDLIIATHGRGLYVLDDLTPLRALTAATLEAEAAFLPSRPSAMETPVFEPGFTGDAEFVGRSLNEAALIAYYLKRRHLFGDLKVEVHDAGGALLSSVPGGKRRGLNRVEWPMRRPAPRMAPGSGLIPNLFALLGPRVAEGTYTVTLIKGKETYTSQVTLVPDPRSLHSADDRAEQRRTVQRLYALVERLAYLVDAVTDLRTQARSRAAALPENDALARALLSLGDEAERQRAGLVATRQGEGISGEQRLREELGTLYGNVNGYEGRPTASQLARIGVLEQDLGAALTAFDRFVAEQVASVNRTLAQRAMAPLERLTEEGWNTRRPRR